MNSLIDLRLALATALGGFVLGCAIGWYLTAEWKDAHWEAKLATAVHEKDQLISQANADVAEETRKVLARERQLQTVKSELEGKLNEANRQIDKTLAEKLALNHQLHGLLHDPGKVARGGTTNPDTFAGQSTGDTACGKLSEEASGFLLALTAEADRAAEYANTCRQWVIELSDKMAGE